MDTKAVAEGQERAGGRKLDLTVVLRRDPRTLSKGGTRNRGR